MYTLNNLLDDFTGGAGGTGFNTDATACSGTLAADVLAGKTFFATSGAVRNTSWGPVTGTANTPPGSGTAAGAGQILSTYYAFNAAGAAMSGTASPAGLPATGQTMSNQPYLSDCVTDYPAAGNKEGCDAFYHKGIALSYTNNGDGTITDNATGLEWVQDSTGAGCNNGTMLSWTAAIAFCENLTFPAGGHTDWRLPNIKELMSIVDYSTYNPSLNSIFTHPQSSYYWSSTTGANGTGSAWVVGFNGGYVYGDVKTTTFYVRPVRGG